MQVPVSGAQGCELGCESSLGVMERMLHTEPRHVASWDLPGSPWAEGPQHPSSHRRNLCPRVHAWCPGRLAATGSAAPSWELHGTGVLTSTAELAWDVWCELVWSRCSARALWCALKGANSGHGWQGEGFCQKVSNGPSGREIPAFPQAVTVCFAWWQLVSPR